MESWKELLTESEKILKPNGDSKIQLTLYRPFWITGQGVYLSGESNRSFLKKLQQKSTRSESDFLQLARREVWKCL